MTSAGSGLAQQISQATESFLLTGSLFIVIGLVTTWLLVSFLTRCVISAVILGVVDLIISLEATVVTTSLIN